MAARKCKSLSRLESISSPDTSGDPDAPPVGGMRARRATVGQRWKLRRNLVIYIASQHGASQRMLADVFDLPHSRIAAILKELRQQYGPSPQRPFD